MDPTAFLGAEPIDTGGRIRIAALFSDAASEARQRVKGSIQIGDGKVEFTDEEAAATILEQIVAVTLAGNEWNLADDDGNVFPITDDVVRALYTDPRTMWIYRQVREAYYDLSRFFGTGTPN